MQKSGCPEWHVYFRPPAFRPGMHQIQDRKTLFWHENLGCPEFAEFEKMPAL